jgi:hypothetical protein
MDTNQIPIKKQFFGGEIGLIQIHLEGRGGEGRGAHF